MAAGVTARALFAAALLLAAARAPGQVPGGPAYPLRFVFDGSAHLDRGLSFSFARDAASVDPDGYALGPGTARFSRARLVCGAPSVTTVPGTADPIGSISILGAGVACDGVTPVWVILNSTYGKLSVYVGDVAGAGFVCNALPNAGKGNLTDFLAESIDSSPEEAWIPKAAAVCHGLIVVECNVAIRPAGGSFIPNRIGFVTCRVSDLAGPKNLWWRKHAVSDALEPPSNTWVTMGRHWWMPTWFAPEPMAPGAPAPTRAWVCATDYRAHPSKDGGLYCLFPMVRSSPTSDDWAPGAVMELPGRFTLPGNTTHAHALGVTRFGATGLTALGSRGDGLFNNVTYLWTLGDEGQYSQGASLNGDSLNWLSGGSAWTGPREVHGAVTTAGAGVNTRRIGNQWVGLAPGPTRGTLLVGGDEVNQSLWTTPDLSIDRQGIGFTTVYPASPTNVIPAPAAAPSQNRLLCFRISKGDPGVLGGPYVATLNPGAFDPEHVLNARVLFSPDGVNFGQCWAHRENEQTPAFLVGENVWIGSLGQSTRLGVRCTPVPAWRLLRPLAVAPGGTNLLEAACPVFGVPAGVTIAGAEAPAGLPAPCAGPIYRVTIAPDASSGTPATIGSFRLSTLLPHDAPMVRLRFHVLSEPGAPRPGSTAFEVKLVTTNPAVGTASARGSGYSAAITLPGGTPWSPVVLTSRVSDWGAQAGPGPSHLDMALGFGGGQCVPGSYLIAIESVCIADAPPYPGAAGAVLPDESAAVGGFLLDADWSVLLAGMVPMDSWDKTASAAAPASRPVVALADDSGLRWLEVRAEVGTNELSARFFDGAGYSNGARIGGVYWSAGSPILLALSYNHQAQALSLRASIGGTEPAGATLSPVAFGGPVASIRFSDGQGRVAPMEWFGGLLDNALRADAWLDASLRSLDFLARELPCQTDLNSDGFSDGIDYDLFMGAFEAGEAFADFNCDGFVDGIDYDSFVNTFEAGC